MEKAHLKKNSKTQELDDAVVKGDSKTKEAAEKIKTAREKLEQDHKNKMISDADYQLKKQKIDNVEKAEKNLEEDIQNGKNLK